MRVHTLTASAAAGYIVIGLLACGGGGYGPTTPSGGGTGAVATVTISANGVTPAVLEISAGQQVKFVNTDTATHEMLSTPHLQHTDCPAINTVGALSPGGERTTDRLNTVRICGYHDHRNPDETKFRGQINVGTSTGPGPGYIKR